MGMFPSGKNRQKKKKECVFVNSALKMHCHVVKNTLLQTAFSAIWLFVVITECIYTDFFNCYLAQSSTECVCANRKGNIPIRIHYYAWLSEIIVFL